MGRIIAIDFGRKRTGLAATDEMKLIASALGTVATRDLTDYLTKYTSENDVECIVIGEPRRLNNTPSELEPDIQILIAKIMKTCPGIRIERLDERFTSVIAGRAILDSGIGKMARRNKNLVDTVSATIILQSFMEKEQMIKERKR